MPRPPGLLRPREIPDVVMMICTAGHVDHGKTRLVGLLTGCQTDRLKEEQERGLTIELGFAPCMLGGNLCVGIVDVPGHEKFIRNMVAGVSGIGMAVLVVAADDGVMPQTVEHVQIMELLGVRHGIVALTKTDLVCEELVTQRMGEVEAFLQGTFLDSAPICPVSSETGDGVFNFYEVLVSAIEQLVKTQRQGVFRMPIERTFSQKGFGAVATGIPVSGTIRIGDTVEIMPGGRTGRIRGLQRFLRDAEEGGGGQCLALNISDLGKKSLQRGQVVCLPGYLKPATVIHVQLQAVQGLSTPLRHAEQIKFHTGTSETAAKIYLLDHKTVPEGKTTLATLVLSEPVAVAVQDRFIIRRPSPAMTVAGGEILLITPSAKRPRKSELAVQLPQCATALDGLDTACTDALVALNLAMGHETGATVDELAKAALCLPNDVAQCVMRLCETGTVLSLEGDAYIHADQYKACFDLVMARVTEAKERQGLMSMGANTLRKELAWPKPLWRKVARALEEAGVARIRGDKLLLASAEEGLSEADRKLREKIIALYEETGFKSPRPTELPDLLQAPAPAVEKMLQHLCNEQSIIRLNKNVVLSYNSFRHAQDMIVKIILETGQLDSADFKGNIGSSRKYALAILDYLDARRVTVRVGNDRRLSPNYEKNIV